MGSLGISGCPTAPGTSEQYCGLSYGGTVGASGGDGQRDSTFGSLGCRKGLPRGHVEAKIRLDLGGEQVGVCTWRRRTRPDPGKGLERLRGAETRAMRRAGRGCCDDQGH